MLIKSSSVCPACVCVCTQSVAKGRARYTVHNAQRNVTHTVIFGLFIFYLIAMLFIFHTHADKHTSFTHDNPWSGKA